jgi:hypothetical protein
MMTIDFKALGAKAAAEGADQTQAQVGGGGDFKPVPEGPCGLRLVSYVELGKQKDTIKGVVQIKPKVQLVFEVSGPNHPPMEIDGVKVPHRVSITENYSLNEKANFFKLFGRMNYAGTAQHMIQMLGDAYLGRVVHRKYKKKSDPADESKWTGIAVELKDKDGYTIRPPRRPKIDEATGMETGEWIPVQVAPALTALKGFLWDYADLNQWASLFIEGQWPERKDKDGKVTAPARSKNVLQDTIKRAENFNGSPIYIALASAGQNLDIPDADVPGDEEAAGEATPGPATAAAAATKGDPLAGIA